MIPTVKLMLVLATVLGVVLISIDSTAGNGKCFISLEVRLRNAAQTALKAIGVTRSVNGSYNRAVRGQHVFNQGVIILYSEILQKLDDEILNSQHSSDLTLVYPFNIDLTQTLVAWKVQFSTEEFYVNFNTDVYKEYIIQLKSALVAYIKADTSPNLDDRIGIQDKLQRLQDVISAMVRHQVYVDPMARNRWLPENQQTQATMQLYNQLKSELSATFLNILFYFQTSSDAIRNIRRAGNLAFDGTELK